MSISALKATTAALAFTLALGGCDGDESKPEKDLGGLLHSTEGEERAIDLERAQSELAELERAIARPYAETANELGAHRVKTVATSVVRQGKSELDRLETTTEIAYASPTSFSITAHNDKTYGRDVIYDGGKLYLRPRFGKYHVRAPETASEPAAVLNKLGMTPAAHLELLGPGAAIRTAADQMVAGRAAIKIELEKADSPRKRPSEPLSQRKWRESATTESVSGWVALDKETGVLLAAKLEGKVSFTRDGYNYTMSLGLDHRATGVGSAMNVEVPAPEQQLAAPTTSPELDERETLLRGIAPPARRGKTPDNPRGVAKPTDGNQ